MVAPLVRAKEPDEPLRVWSAGCATGEEAYSLGILFLEQLAAEQKTCRLQIFATDVDDAALEVARKGSYPEIISVDVSAERLGHFFLRLDDSLYQVKKELRETVTFARQNLITDAPFSKLDLIVCRNLLIYLEPEAQNKVLALLHFSLNEGGYLFLGSSETIGVHTDLFETVSKKWRIYRRRAARRREHVEIPIVVASDALATVEALDPLEYQSPDQFCRHYAPFASDQFAPPAVLINRKFEVLYFFGLTDGYLVVPTGEPTRNLMVMAREGLRTTLRWAIQKALAAGDAVTVAQARVERKDGSHPVVVTIRQALGLPGTGGLMLVTFQDSDHEQASPRPPETEEEQSALRLLEYELKANKEDLQTTIEELQSSNEQLKISNEEAMSMNEELQSTNEELETSKEELQSLNEELTTVNYQLQDKVEDLETAGNDVANLLNCTEVAVLFIDNKFRIKKYTPSATKLFSLVGTDLDRPLSDITPKVPAGTLQQDIEHVLQTLAPQEKQLQTPDGCWWNRRITLYRTLDNHIEGAVLTFTDVTLVKRADEQARLLATLLLDSNDAVIVHDFDGRITSWNRGAEQMYGFGEAEAADDEHRPNDSGGVAARASCLLGTVPKGRTRQFLGNSAPDQGRSHPRRMGYCHRP